MQLNTIEVYSYSDLYEMLIDDKNKDLGYIFFDIYRDKIEKCSEDTEDTINVPNLSWESLQKDSYLYDAVIDYIENDSHYTEIISNVLEKKYEGNKVISFEEDNRDEGLYHFYVSDVYFCNKEQLLNLISKNFKELNISLEDIRDHLVEKLI